MAAVIDGSSDVTIWGLTPRARLERFLGHRGILARAPGQIPPEVESVLVLRGDHVFDDRLLLEMLKRTSFALKESDAASAPILAAHVRRADAEQALRWLRDAAAKPPAEIEVGTTSIVVSKTHLVHRKIQASFAIPANEANRSALERFLYDSAYKSVTDLITKWAWPVPARFVVKACVRVGLKPNHVTSLGFFLMLFALWLFCTGQYTLGLVAGWGMTFLDTVDGKLARTTLTASRFGHYLDKLTDLLHPPFWYLAWAFALPVYRSPTPEISLSAVVILIFAFYAVGRLAEGLCSRFLIAGGLFVWRPLDSFFRLITARRNTCLIFLTLGAAMGRHDLAIWLVAVWTVATSLFLVGRLGTAYLAWKRGDGSKLGSWLVQVGDAAAGDSLAARVFARRPSFKA